MHNLLGEGSRRQVASQEDATTAGFSPCSECGHRGQCVNTYACRKAGQQLMQNHFFQANCRSQSINSKYHLIKFDKIMKNVQHKFLKSKLKYLNR